MRLFDVFGNFKRSFYSNFLQNLKEHIMWKKSLLALLVVSPIAFSQVEKSKKSALVTFNESEVTEKITLAKSQWQHDVDKTALLLQQQRESFGALEYLLNGAVKQQSLSASTISLAQGLIERLNSYPLQQDAEWALLKAKIGLNQATESDISAFLQKYPDSIYQSRLTQLPFEQLYQQQAYPALLAYSKKVSPESVQNQCRVLGANYQLLAEKMEVNPELAQANNEKPQTDFVMTDLLNQFEKLWLITPNLPSECANLEAYWKDNGGKTEENIRQKAVNLFEKNAKEGLQALNSDNPALNGWLANVVELFNQPQTLPKFIENTEVNPQSQQVAKLAFAKWLKTLPEDGKPGFELLEAWATKLELDASTLNSWKVNYLNHLFDGVSPEFVQWRDIQIESLKADNLTERRIRMALWQQTETAKWLDLLSNEGKQKLEWRYWTAKNESNLEKRKAIFKEMVGERGFYPMLAAQQLGELYQPPSVAVIELTPEEKAKLPQLDRIAELIALKRHAQAKNEWVNLIKSLPQNQQLSVILYAYQKQWYALAVEGTIQAKALDYLFLRLPDAYSDWFKIALKDKPISKTFAQAIARQESAWNVEVKSHANAMGLMQLLPTTAEKTAKENGLPFNGENDLFQPFNNIMLGTAHLAELNQRYPNNRMLIAAAYNAGAGRVDQWLARSANKLDFDVFVASIPYYETRGYVQNVLAYDYYYQILQKEDASKMFLTSEWDRKY